MDNFTPLKAFEKKKKKINKFILTANILLMIFVVGLTGYYLKGKYFTSSSQACTKNDRRGYCRQINANQAMRGGYAGGYNIPGTNHPPIYYADKPEQLASDLGIPLPTSSADNNTTLASNVPCNVTNAYFGPFTCVNSGVGGVQGMHWSVCANGVIGNSNCNVVASENDNDVDVPTPTPTTPSISNTPTPTTPAISNTPTPTPSNTPTPTPSDTPTPTPTVTPVISNTPTATPVISNTPTSTPIPVLCGTKSCDNATNPCRSNYVCIQANDGSNYCSSPDFVNACKANPSYNACCIAPGAPTATPTEIILAQISASPTTTAKLLQTGVVESFMYWIPATIMLIGLIL